MSLGDFYKLTDQMLGKGAFGVCMLGNDIKTKEEVAVKIIHRTGTNTQTLVKEVSVLKRCEHENIIRMHKYFEEPEQFYMVTELAKGGELFNHIVRRKHYSEEDSKALVR